MKTWKKLWILGLLIVSMLLTSCGELPDAGNVLADGAQAFGQGKQETDYAFMSSDEVMQRLMDEFAGSYRTAQGTPLSEEDKQEVEDSSDEENTIGLDGSVIISSRQEMKQAMHQMFDETKETLNFSLAGGYHPDMQEIYAIFLEVEREDSFDVICLDTYSMYDSGSSMVLSFGYDLDTDLLKQMKEETRTLLKKAESEIDVTGLSDYEIVCAVNDYLCDTVEYPDAEPYAAETHTAYSAFKKGSAVCDGYAKAAKLMLNDFGVECDFVVGDCIGGGGHAWNLVKIEGEWYHMDVTWNDGGSKWDRNAREAYLLVTDDYMKQSRVWDYSLFPASAKKGL